VPIPTPNRSDSAAPRTLALTALAMLAFAANSVLCRLALGQKLIDPASFAAVRVITAALTLVPLCSPSVRRAPEGRPPDLLDWYIGNMVPMMP
jgi:drug/metabolite transporter (DMT)-like permease